MGKSRDEHVLIDSYLRKPLLSRIGSWLLRLTILAFLIIAGGYIFWRMMSPPKQHALRQQYAILDRTATLLEDKGILPVFTEEQLNGTDAGNSNREVAKKAQRRNDVAESGGSQSRRVAKDDSDKEFEIDDAGVVDMRTEEHLQLARKGPNARDRENEMRVKVAKAQVLAQLEHNPAFATFKAKNKERMKTMLFDEIREEVVSLEREMREKTTMTFLEEGGLSVSWKVWDKSDPVTWADFQNQNIDEENGRWSAYISSRLVTTSNGHTWEVFAVMQRQNSWVRPGGRTQRTLRHERVHFDITELFARKLRVRLASEPKSDYGKIFKETSRELKQTQKAYDDDAYASQKNQKRWEERVAKGLKDTANFAWVPNLKRIATAGHPQGIFLHAQTYDHGGYGIERSTRLAKKWYEIGTQHNQADAMNNLGALYLKGINDNPPDPKRAFKLFRRAAKRGNASAKFNLGVMYWRGLGTKPDIDKAMDYFTQAADRVAYARKALIILEPR